jgi:hypothetical protein
MIETIFTYGFYVLAFLGLFRVLRFANYTFQKAVAYYHAVKVYRINDVPGKLKYAAALAERTIARLTRRQTIVSYIPLIGSYMADHYERRIELSRFALKSLDELNRLFNAAADQIDDFQSGEMVGMTFANDAIH